MNAHARIPHTGPSNDGFQSLGRMLAGFGRTVTAAVAVFFGAILALFAAVAVAILAVVGSVLVFLTGMVLRSRRRRRVSDGQQVLEARKVGHAWVAYGWDQPAR